MEVMLKCGGEFIFMSKEKSVFEEEIEEDSNICSNCYRRIKYRFEPHETMPDTVTSITEYSDSTDFDYFHDRNNTGRPCVKRSYCKCGFVDDGKIRPLDKEEMMDCAYRIHGHLTEKDVEHDSDTFFSVMRSEASNPDSQFDEEASFEKAIKKSISSSPDDEQKITVKENEN